MNLRDTLRSIICLFAAVWLNAALAQSVYPAKPITLVVQAAAGGGNDTVARRFAEKLQQLVGQPVIVDNRAGAGGAIGSESVARAAPDGYMLLLITAGETYYKAINKAVKFDVETDFTPIGMLASAPLVLVANSSFPANTLQELVAYAKANPGKVAYGSAGIGSPHHLAGAMLSKAAGVQILHVPYRGTAGAVTDLVAGQLALAFSSPAAIAQFIDAGKVKPIAVADSKRIAALPNVPTIAESGYPEVKFDNWFGIAGPKGMPPAVVKRLSDAIAQIGRDASFTTRLLEIGFQPIVAGPQEFAARIKQDHIRYTRIAESIETEPKK